MLHTFLHPVLVIFSQHMTVPAQPILLQYQCYVIYRTVKLMPDLYNQLNVLYLAETSLDWVFISRVEWAYISLDMLTRELKVLVTII